MNHKRFALLLLLCLCGPLSASASCVDYSQRIHWLGNNPFVGGGSEADATISGLLGYVLRNPYMHPTLQIIDLSNPGSPTLLGSVEMPSTPAPQITTGTGITVVGSLAYVTAAYGGLYIINVSNSTSPSIVGHVDTPGVAQDVAVAGTRAYVADSEAGVQVVNISNPAAPTIIGTVDTPAKAFGVSLNGTIAYVADGLSGVQVIDMSNSLVPVIVGTFVGPGAAQDIVSVGSLLYVADGYSGLVIIDASIPTSPILVGNADTPGYAWDLRIQGTRAYIADDITGLVVVDLSTPSSPSIIATKLTPNRVGAVAVGTNVGVVIDPTYGLVTFDPSVVTPLFMYGSSNEPFTPGGMIGISSSLVCIPYYASLVIMDSSNPLYLPVVNRMLLPGPGKDVVVAGTTGFVTFTEALSGGLVAVDLSNPTDPQELGRVVLPSPSGLTVSGTRAFVVAYGHFPDDPGGNVSNRLVIIDVADPRNPTILGTVIVAGRNPRVSGNLVYLCGNSTQYLGRINVVDVSNPAQPTVIGGLDIPGWEWVGPMAFSGDHGFVPVTKQNPGWDHNGVMKLELTPSPETPRLLGITYTSGGSGGAAVSGTTLFACAGSSGGVDGGGIYLFNVADMSIIGAVDIQRAWNVFTAGGLVYVLSSTGLTILPDHCEGAPVSVGPEPGYQDFYGLGAAFPNPGRNSSTCIPFTVAKPGVVTLRIIDANGREVCTLVNEMMGAGERRVEWDGLNARGERVPAGIYVYELRAPGLNAARKMVRLR